jgi:iron(III) transport system ATP-binding protein
VRTTRAESRPLRSVDDIAQAVAADPTSAAAGGASRPGAPGSILAIERVSVRFGSVLALDDVSLEVAHGEIVCLLGPSGSGKSTLLRLIAGIERPSAGRIVIGGAEAAGPQAFIEPEHRQVGMVFQDYALFPHLNVERNVAFGARVDRAEIQGLLERLGLAELARSHPHQLSGGERQRVALARALAPRPKILLMDEPFASLDSRLRDAVRLHTLGVVREAGTTTVIVTHDPAEALRIADRIALLDRGRLVQVGTPEALYRAPRSLAAARFFSDVAAATGVAAAGRLATPVGDFAAELLPSGAEGVACIRPEHVEIAPERTAVSGRVVAAEYCGDSRRIVVEIAGASGGLPLAIPATAPAPAAGALIHLKIHAEAVPVVPKA